MSEEQSELTPFLKRLAQVLLEQHGEDLRKIVIVLPNQRAGLFLRNELVKIADKAIWSPQVLTMDRLVSAITRMRSLDETELLMELFKVYRALEIDRHDPFHDFVGWASIALKHFNEVDAYLINRKHFYEDITSFEEIENWSLGNDPLSEQQEVMVERWHMHGRLHEAFDKHLTAKLAGFNGLLERRAVELLQAGEFDCPWSTVWFAGLNALTAAEVSIMNALEKAGRAKFVWEADDHYLNDPVHSAGLSLRKHIEHWGAGAIPSYDRLRSAARTVTIGEVPSKIGMVRYVVQYLKSLPAEEIKRTTIVLTDTGLITPLLQALPSSIGAVNVTMSVPLDKVPLAGAITQCIMISERSVDRDKIPIDWLMDLLSNPVVRPLLKDEALKTLKDGWRELNLSMIPVKVLDRTFREAFNEKGEELSSILFNKEAVLLPKFLQRFIDLVKGSEGSLLNEQAYQLANTVKALGHVLAMIPAGECDFKSVQKMWRKLIANSSVGLYGEPLEGLQVMGLLETRAIPLDRVIMLPANEGTLPPSAFERSFIPFDVRRVFKLPTRSDADAVISYHFYRALSSCSEMLLLVDTSKTTEAYPPSRFIDQLQLELNQEIDPTIQTTLHRQFVQAPLASRQHPVYTVEKTPAIIAKIKERIGKGLSPSAINTYLSCPLDFYYQKVLGLKDPDSPEANIQMNVIGTIVHRVVEKCYEAKQELKPEVLKRHIADIDTLFKESIDHNEASGFLDHPRNLFPLHIAKESVLGLLRSELKALEEGKKVEVIAVEEWISGDGITSSGIPFRISGMADRIERRNGQLRVVDLKTGSVNENELRLRSLDYEAVIKKPKALQLLAYAWAYLRSNEHEPDVTASILSARKGSTFPGISLQIDGDERVGRNRMNELDTFFSALVDDMLDPNTKLSHSEDSQYCSFCLVQTAEKEAEASFPK